MMVGLSAWRRKERKKERNAESDNVKFCIFVFHGARPAALLQTP